MPGVLWLLWQKRTKAWSDFRDIQLDVSDAIGTWSVQQALFGAIYVANVFTWPHQISRGIYTTYPFFRVSSDSIPRRASNSLYGIDENFLVWHCPNFNNCLTRFYIFSFQASLWFSSAALSWLRLLYRKENGISIRIIWPKSKLFAASELWW